MEILMFGAFFVFGVLFLYGAFTDGGEDIWMIFPAAILLTLAVLGGIETDNNLYYEGVDVVKFRGENKETIQDTIQDIYFYLPNADTLINKKDLLK